MEKNLKGGAKNEKNLSAKKKTKIKRIRIKKTRTRKAPRKNQIK